MTVRSGYALPLTLAAIIIIALVAAMAAEQIRSSTLTVTQLADQMRARTQMVSAEQTLIYELLTEPMTMNGVAVGQVTDPTSLILGSTGVSEGGSIIRANGQAYLFGSDPVIVRLYDDQSFLNAASADSSYISDYLDVFGVPQEQHSRLIAALRDYQDEDDLRTLGGAEASDYDQPGLPSNQPLRDARELCAVLNWSETPVCSDMGRLLLTFRVRSADQLNPSFVSEPVLSLLQPEAGRDEINAVFQQFADGQLTSFSQIDRAPFDLMRDPLSTLTSPGPYLVLITHMPEAVSAYRTVIELTPSNLNSPFVVHSKYAIGGPYSQNMLRIESIDDVPPLPQPSAITSER